jgi:hypothetical protein
VSILCYVSDLIELTKVAPMGLQRGCADGISSCTDGNELLKCSALIKGIYHVTCEYQQILCWQFLTYDLIVLSTVFKLGIFLTVFSHNCLLASLLFTHFLLDTIFHLMTYV